MVVVVICIIYSLYIYYKYKPLLQHVPKEKLRRKNQFIKSVQRGWIEVLTNQATKKEAAMYLETVFRSPTLQNDLNQMLVECVKDPYFKKEGVELLSFLSSHLTSDPELKKEVLNLLLRATKHPEIYSELSLFTKQSLRKYPDLNQGLVNLFKNVFFQNNTQQAIKNLMIGECVNIIKEDITMKRLKWFFFFVLDHTNDHDTYIRNIIEQVQNMEPNKGFQDVSEESLSQYRKSVQNMPKDYVFAYRKKERENHQKHRE